VLASVTVSEREQGRAQAGSRTRSWSRGKRRFRCRWKHAQRLNPAITSQRAALRIDVSHPLSVASIGSETGGFPSTRIAVRARGLRRESLFALDTSPKQAHVMDAIDPETRVRQRAVFDVQRCTSW